MALQADLFMSKKQSLLEYIKKKGRAKTSEIIYEWGKENFTTRADRYARDLATEGKIRRMSKSKKNFYFPGIKEKVWEIVDWHNNFRIGE